MAIWVAKDFDGTIWLYKGAAPKRDDSCGSFVETEHCRLLEGIYEDIPELTWENSPKELVIKSE